MKAIVRYVSLRYFLIAVLLIVNLLWVPSVKAAASIEVVEELFKVIEADRNAQAVQRAAANYMAAVVQEALSKLNYSASRNLRIKRQIDDETRVLLEDISWEKIKPRYIAVYQEEFTDDELKAVIAYYKTPAGRKFRERQDALNQSKIRITKDLMSALQPRLKQVVDRIVADLTPKPAKDEATAQTPPETHEAPH